jgi:hypothetical protein
LTVDSGSSATIESKSAPGHGRRGLRSFEGEPVEKGQSLFGSEQSVLILTSLEPDQVRNIIGLGNLNSLLRGFSMSKEKRGCVIL